MNEQEANKREEIIQAAINVFAEHGFHKASIKQIAVEAGLKSPSLIYWYFKDKQELLYAAMAQISPAVQQMDNPAGLVELPPDQFFRVIAKAYFATFQNPHGERLLKIFLSEMLHRPDTVGTLAPKMRTLLDLLMAYIQQLINRGELRPHDPQVSARAFIGTLLVYVMGTVVVPPLGVGLPDSDTYADEVVNLFLKGLQNNP